MSESESPSTNLIERFKGENGKRRIVETLLQQRIVGNKTEIAERLETIGQLVNLQPGDVLMEQGGGDNDIYFILSGQADILVNGNNVAIREAGNYVGEMSLIDHAKTRSATVRAAQELITLKVDESSFIPIANEYPEMWRVIASELADRLRQRSRFVRTPNRDANVFIGSSAEQLEIANTMQLLFKHDFSCTPWHQGVFVPGSNSLDDLIAQMNRSDFAVFVLGPDDVVISREKTHLAPRDNVILEFGMFLGKLGKERVFLVKEHKKEIKVPSDLMGVSILALAEKGQELQNRLGPVCHEIRQRVKQLGPF